MRVLHIINSLHFGGAEKLVKDTVPEYIKKGIDTEILVLYAKDEPLYEELTQQHQVNILSNGYQYSIYNPIHIFRIRKKIRDYDIVHVHLFPSFYWAALSTLFLKHKIKLVVTEHSTENRRRNHPIFKYLDTYIYKRYDQIITISKGVQENLKKHLGENYKAVCTINNGIDVALFHNARPYTKSALGIPENSKIIIQVSNFFPQKDQDTLLKAIAKMSENVHLILVGYGRLIEEKKQLAVSLKIDHRVHFLGYRADVPQLLKMADVSVQSSLYEGFGLAMAEGMAAGNPCVGSHVDGLSEVLEGAGILFEPRNDRQLKEILEKLLSNQEYYKQTQKACIERSKRYDISKMIDNYITIYKTIYQV